MHRRFVTPLFIVLVAITCITSSARAHHRVSRRLAHDFTTITALVTPVPGSVAHTWTSPFTAASHGVLQDDAIGEINAIQPIAAPPAFGTEGTWRWQITAIGGRDVDEADNIEVGAALGASYFIFENFSVEFELATWYFDQEGEDSVGFNVNLFFRWHALDFETWTFFLDGGAGALFSTSDVPDGLGSSFNFPPFGGLGASFDIGRDLRLLAGVRWHHISNANLYDTNPGRDSLVAWVGVSVPF